VRAPLVLAAVVALGLLPGVIPARADVRMVSPLALPMVRPGGAADGPVSQRVIDREWGASDDSTYREVDVPGWKSEGLALGLSGVIPGAGQLYAGESSGWLYLLAESVGWMGRMLEHRRADQRYQDMVRFVGDPTDSSSGFSFARYTSRTGSSVDALATLWSGDRSAYYRALADEPAYAAGFTGVRPTDQYGRYSDLIETHDAALHGATVIEGILILNHMVSAFDALRAARINNIPLREQYHLELGERWRHGGPELRAAVVRRF
jgi:hypothetical protein